MTAQRQTRGSKLTSLTEATAAARRVSFQGCSLDRSNLGVTSWVLVRLGLVSTNCGFRKNTLPVTTCVKAAQRAARCLRALRCTVLPESFFRQRVHALALRKQERVHGRGRDWQQPSEKENVGQSYFVSRHLLPSVSTSE